MQVNFCSKLQLRSGWEAAAEDGGHMTIPKLLEILPASESASHSLSSSVSDSLASAEQMSKHPSPEMEKRLGQCTAALAKLQDEVSANAS